uniref:Uncharacterized protein n=1 Tax=Rhizophora mucronata TaxID=61149 RepID=A0A2P2PIJ4_RHIMU
MGLAIPEAELDVRSCLFVLLFIFVWLQVRGNASILFLMLFWFQLDRTHFCLIKEWYWPLLIGFVPCCVSKVIQ